MPPALVITEVLSAAAAASAAACTACTPMRWARKALALLLRVPLMQGMPWASEIQPRGSSRPPCPCPSSLATVRMVPSSKTKVTDSRRPDTQDRVQSPTAVPLQIMPCTPGTVSPLAARLSAPVMILKGMGSCTWPRRGMRPTRAVMTVDPIRVALRGTVYTGLSCCASTRSRVSVTS